MMCLSGLRREDALKGDAEAQNEERLHVEMRLAATGIGHGAGRHGLNGDGKADILWQNDNGSAAVWLMDGGKTIREINFQDNGPTWHVKSAADFNGDGKADILWQNDNGSAAIWLMDGAAIMTGDNLQENGPQWHAKAGADFNGDGKADILWQHDDGYAAIWMMDGTKNVSDANLDYLGTGWHLL